MRLLVFSDLHLDTPFGWAPAAVARERRRALRATLTNICELAADERVDAILCAGDLYEQERFTPDTAAFLRESFAAVRPIRVFLAPGNHDWYGAPSLYRQVPWSDNVHLFTEPVLQPVELADGLTLWGAAHVAPANTDSFFDTGFHVDRRGVNLALFHGSERSGLPFQEDGKQPHAPFSAAQIAAAGLAHAFCGHFHTPKDGDWHTYPGNPDPLTFGEVGERGAVLAEVDDRGAVHRTRHRVAVSAVSDIVVDVTGAQHCDDIRARVEAAIRPLHGVVRVSLDGEVSKEVDIRLSELDGVGAHLDAVMLRLGQLRVGYDFAQLRDERSVRGQFVRDVEADPDLDADTRRRVLLTGLRALDGRTDELEVA